MAEELNNDNNLVLAKNIDDCSNCPLYQHDCVGGWTSGGGGTPIEPPCCSWDGNEEIYEGMYENNNYEPSERELQWEREYILEQERKQKEKREAEYKEQVKEQLDQITRYGNAKVRQSGELCDDWYCPRCRRWFHAWSESSSRGITDTSCNYCGAMLAHSSVLD